MHFLNEGASFRRPLREEAARRLIVAVQDRAAARSVHGDGPGRVRRRPRPHLHSRRERQREVHNLRALSHGGRAADLLVHHERPLLLPPRVHGDGGGPRAVHREAHLGGLGEAGHRRAGQGGVPQVQVLHHEGDDGLQADRRAHQRPRRGGGVLRGAGEAGPGHTEGVHEIRLAGDERRLRHRGGAQELRAEAGHEGRQERHDSDPVHRRDHEGRPQGCRDRRRRGHPPGLDFRDTQVPQGPLQHRLHPEVRVHVAPDGGVLLASHRVQAVHAGHRAHVIRERPP